MPKIVIEYIDDKVDVNYNIKEIKSLNEKLILHDKYITCNHKNILDKIKYNDDLYYQLKNQIKNNVKRFNIIFYSSICIIIIIFYFLRF
jgi:hypothetical protein